MRLKRAIGKLFSHNEIIALWVETNQHSKTLIWRGSAWKLPVEFRSLQIGRFFGTIPESIAHADTINICIKHKPITVDCTTCANRKTMRCPNTSECSIFVGKPHWNWNEKL